ncbi:MAG: protein-glutamate O-methyltransferase CheR [Planctomycetales bacterium]|nr:protein-glutamate O-methyltransferase CheR [Planctomycetales bacterium]
MSLTATDIDLVCDFVRELCGISLDATKGYLIESRFTPLLKEFGLNSYSDLVRRGRDRTNQPFRQKVIDAITTQETSFFRDNSPYEALRFKALPELIDAKIGTTFPKRLRIWSAACSNGQEPYSIGIVLHQMIPDIHSWDIKILATDISDNAISRASRGWYSQLEIDRGVPADIRSRFFTPKDDGWVISDSVRALVSFRKLNLLEPFPPIAPIDLVFCRNVAIYFAKEQRDDLFRRFKKVMSPEAYLFVGASESLLGLGPEFQPQAHCKATFYRPNLPAPAVR